MDWLRKSIWLQWTLSGALLGIGFIFPLWWFAGILGGAYFLYLIQLEQTNKSLYLGAFAAWSIKTATASVWFWSSYPIDWLPMELGRVQLPIIGGYWLMASFSLGVGGAIVAFANKWGRKYIKSEIIILGLIIPSVWVLGEILGSFVFSVVSIGPGGSINSALSFGYSGYLLAENEWLLSFSKIAGVYGLSFLFAVLAIFLLHAVQKTLRKYKAILAITLVLFLGGNVMLNQDIEKDGSNIEEYSIVTIDTSFPIDLVRNREGVILISEELREAMKIALQENPDYIILPEDSRFFDQQKSSSVERSLFQFQYDNPASIVIDSGRAGVDESVVLQTFIYTGVNQKIGQVQKSYLVPQGEFISILYTWIFKILGFKNVINEVVQDIDYTVGSETNQTGLAENVPGILFCFESVAPLGVRTLVNERPDLPFVAHPISHGWFHEPYILWHQLDTMLKVQAVWNNKYIISAGSHVEGKVVTPKGRLESLPVVAEGEMWKVKKTTITIAKD